LKSRLSKLVPCVARALDEAAQRVALRTSEERQAQLEEQIRQAQRMEAIGTLAGGIAHDFNNALTTILGFTELLSADLPDDDRRREDLAAIRKAAEYSAALTRQLLAFSRRQVLAPVQLDLGLVISDLERMLRRVIGENIQLDVDTPAGVSEVLADRGQLEQVLMNLVVNARDAMPDGGKLTVSIEDSTVRYTTPMVEAGRYVLLTVRDSGVGMTREVAERVFEPFFTTKAQGHGTGLGLSTVYGIVKQSGGHISVESVVGKGTTFRVFWPVLPAGAAGDRARRPTEPEAGTRRDSAERHETILLVEDEDAVRDLVRQILVKRGYRVIAAASAEEARATVAHDAPAIDLLLTDAVLRGESGPDLSVALRAARPGLKVLFMSGYVEQTPLRRTQMENAGFLQKPFTPSALVDKVREALDS
ncbi:MAG: response regulator, partial [Acidobacteria bacterium]